MSRLSNQDVFIALDSPDTTSAQALLNQLPPDQCHIKIGLEMFTRNGAAWVKAVADQGYQIFLDLKLYDIPQTVANTITAIGEMGVAMCTLHASGGEAMMRAAREAADALPLAKRPMLLAVTVLTSFSQAGRDQVTASDISIEQEALRLATLARDSGMDGIICSPHEAPAIREACGEDFSIVCPGIRLAEQGEAYDQVRITTPEQARDNGADFLVVGRPITQAANPQQALLQFLPK